VEKVGRKREKEMTTESGSEKGSVVSGFEDEEGS
jgi:hypothetical protein